MGNEGLCRLGCLDGLPNTLWRGGHVDGLDAEGAEGVDDGVDDGGGAAYGAGFAGAFYG